MVSELDETFAGTDLDRRVWFPYYLPHWSSRADLGGDVRGRRR